MEEQEKYVTDESVESTEKPLTQEAASFADETIVTNNAVDAENATVVINSSNTVETPTDGEKPQHMREALSSLPSFDIEPDSAETPTDHSANETVVVTHTSALDQVQTVPDSLQSEQADEEQALSSLVSPTDTNANENVQGFDATPAEPYVSPLASEPITQGYQELESPISQDQDASTPGKAKKVLKRILVVLLALFGVLVIVYVGASIYFTSHFLPNTKVNGESVSGMSVSDLSAYVSSIGDNYKTHVSGDGLDLNINGSDINLVYDGSAYSKQAADQINPWQWPLQISESHEYVVDKAISYDEAKLNEIVGTAVDKVNEGATQPTNATMSYDAGSGKFVIVPDALGTAVNRDSVLSTVSKGVSTLQTEITLGNDELVQPAIKKDDKTLQERIDTVNGTIAKPVTLRIAGKDATTIDKNLMASWFSLDGENNIQVNQDAIKEWAQGTLSEQFDSAGTKRAFTRPDGKQIEVEGSSLDYDYGWCLDGEALAEVLANNLRANNCDPIEVPMKKTAATWNPGGQDWPARYIDVDLSEQYVRMYDDASNVIWETPCVSGNPIYNGGTDTGVYFIYMKASPMELVGLDYDGDGEPDYRSWVTYWMPFDGGEGLHDMTSRYEFGGNIYTYNGSHGCVNLPYSAAEELWGLSEVGDCVVVHW